MSLWSERNHSFRRVENSLRPYLAIYTHYYIRGYFLAAVHTLATASSAGRAASESKCWYLAVV